MMYLNIGSGRAFFRKMYDWPVMREAPIAKDAFVDAGISEDTFEEYISYIRLLYGEYFILNNAVDSTCSHSSNSPDALWKGLVNFCIDHNLMQEFADADGKRALVYAPAELRHFRFVYSYYECPGEVYICSLDEFRLEVEKCLADFAEDERYIAMHYGAIIQRKDGHEILVRDDLNGDILSHREVVCLSGQIDEELDRISAQQEEMTERAPNFSGPMSREEFLSLSSRCKAWVSECVALDRKYAVLHRCWKLVARILESGIHNSAEETCADETLYIYKGNICCLRNHHRVEEAIAVLSDRNGKDIELNVMHCMECEKFFLEYGLYQHYREKHGTILGNLRMIKNGTFDDTSYELADQSPLALCGYTVSKKAGLSQAERQTIIESCIVNGAMTKGRVAYLLKRCIEVNGAKPENANAVKKWREDLDFVLAYNTASYSRYRITKIEKYSRNRFRKKAETLNNQNTDTITYYRVWKLKIYDGSYAYGVEFSNDGGKSWQNINSFSSEGEAERCMTEYLCAQPTNRKWAD